MARPTLALCAVITADGKLSWSRDFAGAWPEWFPPQGDDILLMAIGHEDPISRLRKLWARKGMQRVVCFGGPKVFRQLFDSQLVAEVFLIVFPTIDGRREAATLSGMPDNFFPTAVRCRLLKMEVRGQECLLHYRVLRTRAKRVVTA